MSRLLRPGLGVLAATELVLGSWTLLFPASFYAAVPTVDLTPPFSEHLFRDFGGATLGLAIVLTAAAVWTDTRLVVVALLAYLAFSVPHLVFHLGHLDGAGEQAGTALVVVLTGSVVLPVALLIVTLRNSPTPESVGPRTGGRPIGLRARAAHLRGSRAHDVHPRDAQPSAAPRARGQAEGTSTAISGPSRAPWSSSRSSPDQKLPGS